MRAIIQKVSNAKVEVENKLVSEIGEGFMVLLGVKETDEDSDIEYIKRKISNLRIFEDENFKMKVV